MRSNRSKLKSKRHIFRLIDHLESADSFSKHDVEKKLHTTLSPALEASNSFFWMCYANNMIEAKLVQRPDTFSVGEITLRIATETGISLADVRQRFSEGIMPVPSDGVSPYDYWYYRRPKGVLKFGFTKNGTQYLAEIILDRN